MKKKILLLGIILVIFGIPILGCALSNLADSLSNTSNVTEGMTECGTEIMLGTSDIAGAVEDIGDASSSTVNISSIKTMSGQIPETFKTTNIASDGYVLVTNESQGGGHPFVRMITKGGDIVDTDYIAGKKLAGGIEWDNFFSTNGPGQSDFAAIAAFVASANKTFTQISTYSDYIAWAHIAEGLKSHYQTAFSDPEAGANDKPNRMECKLVFGNAGSSSIKKASTEITGEVSFNITLDSSGKPKDGTYQGTGSLTIVNDGTTSTFTVTMTLTFQDGEATSFVLDGSESTKGYTLHMEADLSAKTGSGNVKNSSGTELFSFTCNSTSYTITQNGESTTYQL